MKEEESLCENSHCLGACSDWSSVSILGLILLWVVGYWRAFECMFLWQVGLMLPEEACGDSDLCDMVIAGIVFLWKCVGVGCYAYLLLEDVV